MLGVLLAPLRRPGGGVAAGGGAGDVKNCPFCGGKAVAATVTADNGELRHFFRCLSCGCEGPWAKSESGAVHWWEMRVSPEGERPTWA